MPSIWKPRGWQSASAWCQGRGNCLRLLPAMCEREKHWGARGVPMPQEERVLTHGQARAFYDWMGAKQDWQAFYEERAAQDLVAHAVFENSQAGFGCCRVTGARSGRPS